MIRLNGALLPWTPWRASATLPIPSPDCENMPAKSSVTTCATNTGGCESRCTNTDGAFFCWCDPGYVLAANARDCDDFDECAAGTHNCSGTCANLQTDAQHCNSCTTACLTGQDCVAGKCGCPAGEVVCNAACTSAKVARPAEAR